jgi:hypothetical protein
MATTTTTCRTTWQLQQRVERHRNTFKHKKFNNNNGSSNNNNNITRTGSSLTNMNYNFRNRLISLFRKNVFAPFA